MIWVKLWGNLSFNPISALTGETLEGICDDEATVAVVRRMMVEAAEIVNRVNDEAIVPAITASGGKWYFDGAQEWPDTLQASFSINLAGCRLQDRHVSARE